MPTAMEKRLGELLIEDQIITPSDLEIALRRQAESGVSLGRILIDMGKASTSILQRRLRLGYGRAARILKDAGFSVEDFHRLR